MTPVRFVNLSFGRAATNTLRLALDHHPLISADGELFNRMRPEIDNASVSRARHPVRYLEDVYRHLANRKPGAKALGFKLHFRHSVRVFRTLVGDPTVRKILLRRRNKLKQFVSFRACRESGQWECETDNKIVVNIHEFTEWLDELETHQAFCIQNSSGPFLTLDYEDFIEHFNCHINSIQEFLGVESIALSPGRSRYHADDVRQRVVNADDIADLIAHWEQVEQDGFKTTA